MNHYHSSTKIRTDILLKIEINIMVTILMRLMAILPSRQFVGQIFCEFSYLIFK